jgi:hypothetical protein
MPNLFVDVAATLTATDAEVAQFEAAQVALATARAGLATAQSSVATEQVNVTAATEATSAEKADVVAGITTALDQLNAILATLQE